MKVSYLCAFGIIGACLTGLGLHGNIDSKLYLLISLILLWFISLYTLIGVLVYSKYKRVRK